MSFRSNSETTFVGVSLRKNSQRQFNRDTIGGLIGARIALATDPLLLRRLFAALLVVLAGRLIVSELRRRGRLSDP